MFLKYIPYYSCIFEIVKMQKSYSPYHLLVTALIILWLTIMMRLIKELIIHKQPRFLPWQIFSVHKYMKVYRNIPDIKVIINSILYVHILSHFIQGIITFLRIVLERQMHLRIFINVCCQSKKIFIYFANQCL